jgi:hypothetical protein
VIAMPSKQETMLAALRGAERDMTDARERRAAILSDIAQHVRERMKANGLHRGHIRERLNWPPYRLGNFLHNNEGISLPEMKRLLETIEKP